MTKRPLTLLLLMTSAILPRAFAAPVIYTLTGYLQATGGGQTVNAPFTWTVTADTAGITKPAAGRLQNSAISSSLALTGVATTPVVNVTVYLNTTTGQVTFGNSTLGGIGLTNSALQTWDMSTPIGPLTGTNFLVAGSITTDTGTVITLTGVTNTNGGPGPTFQAAQPPPTVTNVVNAASNNLPGLPNAGIAQGAIFVAFGSGLGPASIAISPTPFQTTTLSATSVAITVNGTTVNAPLYYTSSGQISGLLPSNTPTGTGTITVTYNGRAGTPAPITVVSNNIGVFTVTADGQGAGIVTYADYSLVSPSKATNCGGPNTTCGAANPGDTLILWATGLGPVSGGTDASGAGLGVNMSNIPLTMWVGGVQATVLYQGRSGCCVGEDQIVFTVPNNVATGCAVPVTLQINNQISNSTFMPIAAGSRTCTAANAAVATVNVQQAFSNLPINYGQFQLSRDFNSNGTGYQDTAKLQFFKVVSIPAGIQPFVSTYLDDSALNTCVVYNSLNAKLSPSVGTATADAGPSFTLTGPNGPQTISASGKGSVTLSAGGTYFSPGAYTLSGKGGADIGAISTSFNIPPAPVMTNPSSVNLGSVTRSNGLPLAWTGGAPNAYMQIQITGATDNTNTNGATVVCNVAASKGSFTVPAYALLSLPAGNSGLFVQQQVATPFTAKGLDLGVLDLFNGAAFIPFVLK